MDEPDNSLTVRSCLEGERDSDSLPLMREDGNQSHAEAVGSGEHRLSLRDDKGRHDAQARAEARIHTRGEAT